MTTEVSLLEDVLFAFRQEFGRPTPEAVRVWTSRYPRFAADIREAATLLAEMELQAALNRPSPDDERLVAAARSSALDALHRASAAAPAAGDALTLADALRTVAFTADDLGRQMSLAPSIISQVVRGKVMGATIPEMFTCMLARLLGRDVDWVRGRYPGGVIAAYAAPSAAGYVRSNVSTVDTSDLTFQEVVMDANGMDESQRRYWLQEP